MGLALYCVLEAWGFGLAEDLVKEMGTHPNRNMKRGIWASTGSLGHGIGLAVGMAIADKTRKCLRNFKRWRVCRRKCLGGFKSRE